VVLDVEERGTTKRLCFTGDLGRQNMPILRDPEIPTGVDVLVTESTYGDRTHPPIQEVDEQLAAVVQRTAKRGGKVVIPSFALERAQEIVLSLKRLSKAKKIPPIAVYVDSPLTVKITDIFKLHPECYDDETRAILRKDSPFDFAQLHYVSDKEESKAIDMSPEPAVIISASGMCESGRIVHHLKATVEDDRNTICIVGFQAQHTLGRRFVEQRTRVKIFGVERDRRADVVVMNGFSAHADRSELIAFAEAVRDKGHLERVALVHGEPKAQGALERALDERGFPHVVSPDVRDRLEM
jgi:metallo-beta-lactamase family protein